ncbi:sugar-binding domain-containing protein [Paenibacillus antibioticophila]|uniref:sugar-binding domain-containing protein n=1 Tax=Paenibacillus antibioticophila TaxID=1274374 RepID=UPI001BB338DA
MRAVLDKLNLAGDWRLELDKEKKQQPPLFLFQDTINLPNTTSHARKGQKNTEVLIGGLTDEYAFEGYAWFEREVEIPASLSGKSCFLFLERTRVTKVWVDGQEIGSQNSLNTPHLYDLSDVMSPGKHTLTIRVDNTDYPTKGGHLTSPDTQTNWNGITGRMELQFFGEAFLDQVQVYPNFADRSFTVTSRVVGNCADAVLSVTAVSYNGEQSHSAAQQDYVVTSSQLSVTYKLGEDALLWSEDNPYLYKLTLRMRTKGGDLLDEQELSTGLREFKAAGDKFTINGRKTFLRGKHDGLIFPLTGYAPTEVEEWVRILGISKSYGINHYRFHTCCPPEAAFIAADLLGIYMEPELPFWGTITDESHEQHNQEEQDYLIREGFAMLQAFGNHPSFVMMSLGNELWGSHERLNSILKDYKAFDDRHLYTQGSNNFQFVPVILEQEDFFCGVRFSRDRLFRGSYAMCDAPLGHVQTDRPGTMMDYNERIVPMADGAASAASASGDGTIQIQYGTEARTVKADVTGEGELVPHVPVVSHEIGQYAVYPNFEEIDKYTGPLKAKNFEVFRERLEAKGMGHLARKFFESSGQLAVACYKEELEAALRSSRMAGFQILDLQDFPGQGTALVGVLDAFMDSKGLVTPEEWRTFCSDAVLLARFEKYNYEAGESFRARVQLSYYRAESLAGRKLVWEIRDGQQKCVAGGEMEVPAIPEENLVEIGNIQLVMPAAAEMKKVVLSLSIPGTDVWKKYDLWIYPNRVSVELANAPGAHLFEEPSAEMTSLLEKGESILLLPRPDALSGTIEGLYSTDFWCYPMFRSISESMNRPVPVGTMGLLIQNGHPALKHFPSEEHSTYSWWSTVTYSHSIILDQLPQELTPIVQTIDNFERNHKLGLLSEFRVLNGRVLMGALDYGKILETPEGRQLFYSLTQYMNTEAFNPAVELSLQELQGLFKQN